MLMFELESELDPQVSKIICETDAHMGYFLIFPQSILFLVIK